MDFNIQKENGPIYQQIIDQIEEAVSGGYLNDGTKLPSERELSKLLNISRGSVTKAYDHLENMQVITRIKGKGCYISRENEYVSLGRKDQAIIAIKNTVNQLEDLGFSLSEIRIFTELVLMEKDKKYRTIKIGIIDCNKEALHAIKAQIGNLKDVSIRMFLLDDLKDNPILTEVLGNDMLITTYTHYEQVSDILRDDSERLIRVSMSPSKKTFIQIGRIRQGAKILIIHESDTFLRVMKKALALGEIELSGDASISINNPKEEVASMLKHAEVIISPPLHYFEPQYAKWLMSHVGNKTLIEFEYLMERGNLLFLEERIRRLMIQK